MWRCVGGDGMVRVCDVEMCGVEMHVVRVCDVEMCVW